jgi:hypothetical protein
MKKKTKLITVCADIKIYIEMNIKHLNLQAS